MDFQDSGEIWRDFPELVAGVIYTGQITSGVSAGDPVARFSAIEGGVISVADGWQHGPSIEKEGRWEPAELGGPLRELLARAPAPAPVYGA